jgi:hypothetical protein
VTGILHAAEVAINQASDGRKRCVHESAAAYKRHMAALRQTSRELERFAETLKTRGQARAASHDPTSEVKHLTKELHKKNLGGVHFHGRVATKDSGGKLPSDVRSLAGSAARGIRMRARPSAKYPPALSPDSERINR